MYQFEVSKTHIKIKEKEPLVAGTQNSVLCSFQFSQDWENMDRTAVFYTKTEKRSCVLASDNCCTIPWEVLQDAGRGLYAGVYGDQEGETILITVPVCLGEVLRGVLPGEVSEPPTPVVYDQLMSAVSNAVAEVALLRQDIESGLVGSLPGGGTAGQVLTKQSEDDHDAAWQDLLEVLPVYTGEVVA